MSDRQSVQLGYKEKAFIDLYSLAISRIPKTDKLFITRLQELLKNKQKHDIEALSSVNQPTQVNSLIKEKEKLQIDLDKALSNLEQVKTLLA